MNWAVILRDQHFYVRTRTLQLLHEPAHLSDGGSAADVTSMVSALIASDKILLGGLSSDTNASSDGDEIPGMVLRQSARELYEALAKESLTAISSAPGGTGLIRLFTDAIALECRYHGSIDGR